MKKVMRLVMDVTVEDLSDEKRQEIAESIDMTVDELEGLVDTDPMELARTIGLEVINNEEMFAGSDLMVECSKFEVQEASWLPEQV